MRGSPSHCILARFGQAVARSQACTEVQEIRPDTVRHISLVARKGFPCSEAGADAPQGAQLLLFSEQVQAHSLQEARLWDALLADPEPATPGEEALLPGCRQL